jgi:hypothetical protein
MSNILFIYLSSRQTRSSTSKSTKRLIESQTIAQTRRAATKKYQTAIKQRSQALEKNALDKAEKIELVDPQVSEGYDLWNTHDEKKGNRSISFSSSFSACFIEKIRSAVGSNMASYMEQVYQTYDWKVPKHIIKKPTKLPAIDKPLPGTSYNPTYDDHQVKNKSNLFIYFLLFN